MTEPCACPGSCQEAPSPEGGCPSRLPAAPPDPRGKKWVLLQLLGGVATVAGILVTTYLVAQLAQARQPLRLPAAALLIPAGLAVHAAGRLGLRRLGG